VVSAIVRFAQVMEETYTGNPLADFPFALWSNSNSALVCHNWVQCHNLPKVALTESQRLADS